MMKKKIKKHFINRPRAPLNIKKWKKRSKISKERETKIKDIQEVISENMSITILTKFMVAQGQKPIIKEQLTIVNHLLRLHLNVGKEIIFEIDILSFNH